MQGILNVKCDVSVGDRFGELTVIGRPFYVRAFPGGRKRVLVVCEDLCGGVSIRRADKLKTTSRRSTPIVPTEGFGLKMNTRTRTGLRLLRDVWREMVRRCYDKRRPKYPRYGGRGIGVCDEWRFDYVAFFKWAIRSGYRFGLQIDRIDNDGNYCPENCRFVEPKWNIRNSTTAKITLTQAVSVHASAALGIDANVIAITVGVSPQTIDSILSGTTWGDAMTIWNDVEKKTEAKEAQIA